MAENLLIRDLDEKSLEVLNYAKKKFDISTNTKATLKVFQEYANHEEKEKKYKKKIEDLEDELRELKYKMQTIKEAFNIVLEK